MTEEELKFVGLSLEKLPILDTQEKVQEFAKEMEDSLKEYFKKWQNIRSKQLKENC